MNIDDKVIKNPDTWIPNNFDNWGRGIGVGTIVEPPFELEENYVDVKWEKGRCFEHINQLLNYNSMIKLTPLENGDLKIAVENIEDFKHEIELFKEKQLSEDAILEDLLDAGRYLGNDWHCNQIIGLTEAPNICYGALYAETDSEKITEYLESIKTGIDEEGIDFAPASFRHYLEQDCDIEPELPINFERVWYYPFYMTKSFLVELEENNFVVFKLAI